MRAALLLLALATSPDEPEGTGRVLPPVCTDERPATRFDPPACDDLAAGRRLEQALEGGDLSLLGEVRRRYEHALTYRERHHLGRLLLDHLEDDTTIWNDLSAEAVLCLRYARDSEKLQPLARRQNAEPSRVWWASSDALAAIAHDPRARHLLHRALASDDGALRRIAVAGFALQKDFAALPAIAAALERHGSNAGEAALGLAHYGSEEADALAMKFMSEAQRERYRAVTVAQLRVSAPR